MWFIMNFFSKYVFWPKIANWQPYPQTNFGGIAFSDPQQFSEIENFGPLGAGWGGGVHGEESWPID